ncbi:hypothetical protein DUI87_21956 [Hirundo rustica rustica]|uniref:ETS domain-containing protein n=1 Tax=Hirundo rustica rustica TaxID=333673 RepID=A0A3M0K3C6_HIRRU|nr:hypothetical protein DUI87_21956 [Hirundo rustica rustica]
MKGYPDQQVPFTFPQVPDNDEQFVPDFHSENLAFHSPPAKIKKEPQSPSELTVSCSQQQPFQHSEQCLYASAYDQARECPSPGVLLQPPLQQFPRQERSFLSPAGPSSTASCGYLGENSSAYQPAVEMCHPFPPAQEDPTTYQCQLPKPCLQHPPQGFKEEQQEAQYEQAKQFPAVLVKQEQLDYIYDSEQDDSATGAFEMSEFVHCSVDVPDCPSMYMNAESYPSHSNPEDALGCSYDKQMRPFADDVCVVPEKFEATRPSSTRSLIVMYIRAALGRAACELATVLCELKYSSGFCTVLLRNILFVLLSRRHQAGRWRVPGGTPYQRRGSLQLWQFLVALLDNPTNSHFIAWTGRGMEFKLIEPEEVARLWGIQKNRPAMNYDKLSRSLRYYYEKGIMQKVAGERYVYKFVCEPEALFSMAFPEQQRPALKAEFERQLSEEDTVPLSHLDESGSYLPDLGSFPPQLYSKGYTY